MLVLSRRQGERLLVPQCDLVITVVAVRGKAVRLGITAPGEVQVYREEVWRRDRSPGDRPAPPGGRPRRREAGVAAREAADC
jgi:carbon storage regulator